MVSVLSCRVTLDVWFQRRRAWEVGGTTGKSLLIATEVSHEAYCAEGLRLVIARIQGR